MLKILMFYQLNDTKLEVARLIKDIKNMETEFLAKTNRYDQLYKEAEEL